MNGDESRVADYLGHILEAINRIDSYTEGMAEADFLDSGIYARRRHPQLRSHRRGQPKHREELPTIRSYASRIAARGGCLNRRTPLIPAAKIV
jgi:hypothetical protein